MMAASPVSLVLWSIPGCVEAPENGRLEWRREVIPVALPAAPATAGSAENGPGAGLSGAADAEPGAAQVRQAVLAAPGYAGFVVGRRPNCAIRLQDGSISGYHCKLVVARRTGSSLSMKSEQDGADAPALCAGDDATSAADGAVGANGAAASAGSGAVSGGGAAAAAAASSPSSLTLFIVDSSTNGTFVDGHRLRPNYPTPLSSSSVVSLARSKVVPGDGSEGGGASAGGGAGTQPQTVFAFRAAVVADCPRPVQGRPLVSHARLAQAVFDLDEVLQNDFAAAPPSPSRSAQRLGAGFVETQATAGAPAAGVGAPLDSSRARDPGFSTTRACPTGGRTTRGPQQPLPAARRSDQVHNATGPHAGSSAGETPPKPSAPAGGSGWAPSAAGASQSTMSSSGFDLHHPGPGAHGANRLTASATRGGGAKLADMLKRLQEANAKKDAEIAELAEELERAETAHARDRATLEALTRQVQHLRDLVAKAEAETAAATAAARAAQEKNGKQRAEVERLQQEVDRRRAEAAELETRLSVAENRVESSTVALRDVQKEKHALQELAERLRGENDELCIRAKQSASQCEAARAEAAEARGQADSRGAAASAEIERLAAALHEAQLASDQTRARGRAAEAENAHLKEVNGSLQSRCSELCIHVSRLESEAAAWRNDAETKVALARDLQDLLAHCAVHAGRISGERVSAAAANAATKSPPTALMVFAAEEEDGEGGRRFHQATYQNRTPASPASAASSASRSSAESEAGFATRCPGLPGRKRGGAASRTSALDSISESDSDDSAYSTIEDGEALLAVRPRRPKRERRHNVARENPPAAAAAAKRRRRAFVDQPDASTFESTLPATAELTEPATATTATAGPATAESVKPLAASKLAEPAKGLAAAESPKAAKTPTTAEPAPPPVTPPRDETLAAAAALPDGALPRAGQAAPADDTEASTAASTPICPPPRNGSGETPGVTAAAAAAEDVTADKLRPVTAAAADVQAAESPAAASFESNRAAVPGSNGLLVKGDGCANPLVGGAAAAAESAPASPVDDSLFAPSLAWLDDEER